MNKTDLAAAVRSFHGGVTGAEAVRIVDAVFRGVADGLAAGGALRIRGFGSLEVRTRRPRRGADPRTRRAFVTSAHRTAFFRPSRALLRSIGS